ncbi:hypothetical protein [Microbispora rosea]
MRQARGPARAASAGAVLVALALLAGCSSTVHVEPPTPTGEAAAACRALDAALPKTLDSRSSRRSRPR